VAAFHPDDIAEVDRIEGPGADPGDAGPFAYCQFTSGSGGRAKGVLLTHENVLTNIRARNTAYEIGEEDVAVTWLPFYHDMGLIGYVLHPLVTGLPCHVIPPSRFLTEPVAWLALISRVRGTISTAPNLAYGMCARRISDEQMLGIDLSCWTRAFNGAEPVTREVVDAFVRRFAPFGFRPTAMLAGYGLAENTLTATSGRRGEGTRFEEVSLDAIGQAQARLAQGDEPRRAVASVGRPLPGQDIAILDEAGLPLGERALGEIAIRSGSVMHGYLPGSGGETTRRPDGWLLTGDLGYLAAGELFVLGRKKDLIIRAGINHYPEELEEAVARVAGPAIRRAAAFSVPGPERELVILVVERRKEWAGDPAALTSAIREAVFAEVRFVPDDIVLVPASTLPLTTSGKLIRPEARRLYQEGRWPRG
jgi:acyl-CoA synthetase (AMP-forming)/AMP-acid ligase II